MAALRLLKSNCQAIEMPAKTKSRLCWRGAGTAMSKDHDADREHSRRLKRQWEESDAAREKLETRAKELFLEEQANEIFAPIEDCLTRLDKVLRPFNASVEIDHTWEHFDEQRLRRTVKVKLTQSDQQLSLDFNIHGVRIFHLDKFPVRSKRLYKLSLAR
jgi:hypothetical protein